MYIDTRTEDSEQEAVIEWCAYRKITVVHIPNEGKRTLSQGRRIKRIGLQKGFPDLFFPEARKGFHGLFIELKRDRRSSPTREQKEWIELLNSKGYRATVCYGAEDAIAELCRYFDIP